MDAKALCTRKQAAQYAGVSVRTIDKWVEAGVLTPRAWTPKGSPRFHPDDLLCATKPKLPRWATK